MALDGELMAKLQAYKVSELGESVPTLPKPNGPDSRRDRKRTYDPDASYRWTSAQNTLAADAARAVADSEKSRRRLVAVVMKAKSIAPSAPISSDGFRMCFLTVSGIYQFSEEEANTYFESWLAALGQSVAKLEPVASVRAHRTEHRNRPDQVRGVKTPQKQQSTPSSAPDKQTFGQAYDRTRSSQRTWDKELVTLANQALSVVEDYPSATYEILKYHIDGTIKAGPEKIRFSSTPNQFKSQVWLSLTDIPPHDKTVLSAYTQWRDSWPPRPGSSPRHQRLAAKAQPQRLVGARASVPPPAPRIAPVPPEARQQLVTRIRKLSEPSSFSAGLKSLDFLFRRLADTGEIRARQFLSSIENAFLLIVRKEGLRLAQDNRRHTTKSVRDGVSRLPTTRGLALYGDSEPRLLAWGTADGTTQTLSVRLRDLTEFVETGNPPHISRFSSADMRHADKNNEISLLAGIGTVIGTDLENFGCIRRGRYGYTVTTWSDEHTHRMKVSTRSQYQVREFERHYASGKIGTVAAHTRGRTNGSKKAPGLKPRTQTVTGKKNFRA